MTIRKTFVFGGEIEIDGEIELTDGEFAPYLRDEVDDDLPDAELIAEYRGTDEWDRAVDAATIDFERDLRESARRAYDEAVDGRD